MALSASQSKQSTGLTELHLLRISEASVLSTGWRFLSKAASVGPGDCHITWAGWMVLECRWCPFGSTHLDNVADAQGLGGRGSTPLSHTLFFCYQGTVTQQFSIPCEPRPLCCVKPCAWKSSSLFLFHKTFLLIIIQPQCLSLPILSGPE